MQLSKRLLPIPKRKPSPSDNCQDHQCWGLTLATFLLLSQVFCLQSACAIVVYSFEYQVVGFVPDDGLGC